MKKIALVVSALLLSTNVAFALDNIIFKDHSNVALDHAKNAATAENATEVVHHAGAALEHTLTASISAKAAGIAGSRPFADRGEAECAVYIHRLKRTQA